MNILHEREKSHGSWKAVSSLAAEWKARWRNERTLPPAQAEALDMIITKMARIICGDASHKDHWVDIAGYALLGAGQLPEPQGGIHERHDVMRSRRAGRR
jgi:hypothetical protein